jgi:pimeloyl-ACP methyl ester carboxylesterase
MKKSKSILTKAMVVGAIVMKGIISYAQSGTSLELLSSEAIRPFQVHVPKKELADLKHRLSEARLPDKETVTDQSQGVQLKTMQELVHYWATEYDWRKAEAKLNALPQYVTKIDGLDIYFIHVRSKEPNALPIIITHGWPGSIFEELKLIGPLTDPVAYGGKPEDAFDVVIPSLPGYGFSGKPTTTGWNTDRIARAWDTLMKRLGYTRYVAQGGDWGSKVSGQWLTSHRRGCLACT